MCCINVWVDGCLSLPFSHTISSHEHSNPQKFQVSDPTTNSKKTTETDKTVAPFEQSPENKQLA